MQYLKKHKQLVYLNLLASGRLNEYIASVDEQAEDMFSRIDAELLKKFRFVADYNARSANRELEVLMKKHIAEFEKENGKGICRQAGSDGTVKSRKSAFMGSKNE